MNFTSSLARSQIRSSSDFLITKKYLSFFDEDCLSIERVENAVESQIIKYYHDVSVNPLTPMSDQDRISPNNINQISDESKEKYKFGDN